MFYLHHIKRTLRRLRNTKWNPKNNNSYGNINFLRRKGICDSVTIHSLLRQQNLIQVAQINYIQYILPFLHLRWLLFFAFVFFLCFFSFMMFYLRHQDIPSGNKKTFVFYSLIQVMIKGVSSQIISLTSQISVRRCMSAQFLVLKKEIYLSLH